MFLDERRAYRAFKATQAGMIDTLIAASRDGTVKLTAGEQADLVAAATTRFKETTGLTRALLAFAILSVLTVALVSVLVSSAADAPDLRKTIITALLSILATIVGFYFGAKTAETGQALAGSRRRNQRWRVQRRRPIGRQQTFDLTRANHGAMFIMPRRAGMVTNVPAG